MMKNRQNRQWLAVAVASAAVAQFGAQAGLSQLSVGVYYDYSTTVVAQGYTHSTVATAFNATRIGGDALPVDHSNPFITFCLDINTSLASGWWQSGNFSSVTALGTAASSDPNTPTTPAVRNVATGLNSAANLYAHYASGVVGAFSGDTAKKVEGAALQLAIWEVLYETGNTFDVMSGAGFRIASIADSANVATSAIAIRANQMLAAFGSPNFNIDTTFWNAVNQNGSFRSSQDLIGPQAPVPEPGTFIAGGLLLLPFLASTFRRKVS